MRPVNQSLVTITEGITLSQHKASKAALANPTSCFMIKECLPSAYITGNSIVL